VVALAATACGPSAEVRREVKARLAGDARAAGATAGSFDSGAGAAAPAVGAGAGSNASARARPGSSVRAGDKVSAADAAAAGKATDRGVTADTIRIGGTYFNGGFLDKYSQVTEQAAAAYFNFVNDQGGVHGRKIEYTTCDTAGTTNGTQGCLRKLNEQNKVFIMGPSLDFNLDTVQDYLARNHLPWVGSSGLYAAEFTSPWMFPTQLEGAKVGAMIATFAARRLGAKRIGVSWVTIGAGPTCLRSVRDLAPLLGYQVVVEAQNQESESDLSSQVIQTRGANPDTVLFCNDPVNNIKFIQAAGRQGYKPAKGWVAGFVAADDVPKAMGPPGVGLYGFTAYDFYKSNSPGVKEYRDIVHTYFPSAFFHFYSQAAYTGARAIHQALINAGPNLTRDRFILELRKLTAFDSKMGITLNFSNLRAQRGSGLMLRADQNLDWQVATPRFQAAR
jgi:branched-chain amino acid transport system substrate-binding protein